MNTQLEDRLGQALHDLAGERDFAVDLDAIERSGRRAKLKIALTGGGVTLTVAAVTAAMVGLGGTGGTAPTPKITASAAAGPAGQLTRLADYVLAGDPSPSGDATKVIRTTTLTGQAPTVGADLFADDGDYFYSDDPAGLAGQVAAHDNLANGVFGREVAIAQFAANGGDLGAAEARMAGAAFDPGRPYRFVAGNAPSPFPPGLTGAQKKAFAEKLGSAKVAVVDFNSTWSNSLDALIAGAGQPDVRAGVLRILSTIPTVTVTTTTTHGEPTLTISNAERTSSGTYVESLALRAKDGVPVLLTGGDEGQPVSVSISYQVSRVTLSQLG